MVIDRAKQRREVQQKIAVEIEIRPQIEDNLSVITLQRFGGVGEVWEYRKLPRSSVA